MLLNDEEIMVVELIAVMSLVLSAVLLGAFFALLHCVKAAERALIAEADRFDEITEKASLANNSLALKIGDLERRLETVSFHAQQNATKPSANMFGGLK